MKKLLLLLALVGMVAYGCTDSSTDDDNNPPTEQPGQGGPSGDEDLTFTNNTNTAPTISHEGGTAKISFTAALSWSVSVYADWLSVSPDEGEAGSGSFVITAEPNTTANERKGVVAIKLSNHKSYEITVKQSFNADSDDIEFINNTNTAPHMEFGGGTVQIAFIAKTDWTVTCYADWLSTSKSSGSKGENSFFITAASNPKEEERSGVVAIKSKNNKSYEIKVTQDPNAGIMQLTVAANEVLYTTVFDTQIKLYNENGFGGNLISHSYDVEKGYGSIRFDNYVTSIPSKAFKDCTTLESIYLPEGVTYIAPDAFEGCTNLKYIISPNSDNYTMFVYNGEIMAVAPAQTNFIVPEGVTSIVSGVFTGTKVESVILPSTLQDIAASAFEGCTSLKSVTINSAECLIREKAFYSCSALQSLMFNVDANNYHISYNIGTSAFENCSLSYLEFPGHVSLGDYAFQNGVKGSTGSGKNRFGGATVKFLGEFSLGTNVFNGCSIEKIDIADADSWVFQSFETLASNPLSGGAALYVNGSPLTEITINFNPSNYLFAGCNSLQKVTLGSEVTAVGKYTFYNCTDLKELSITDKLKTFGSYSFAGCTCRDLKIVIPVNATLDSYAFANWQGHITVGVLSSHYATFYGCTGELVANELYSDGWLSGSKFSKITIGDSVKEIPAECFEGQPGTIVVPNSVTTIKNYAFDECDGELIIYSPVIGNSLSGTPTESNGNWLSWSNFKKVTIGYETVGSYVFNKCETLKEVTLLPEVAKIGTSAFSGCTLERVSVSSIEHLFNISGMFLLGNTSLCVNGVETTDIVIPNTVTTVRSAFANWTKLTSVTMGDSVESITSGAFRGCSSLSRVTLGKNITTIGSSAFSNCTSLKSIEIPSGVTMIDEYTFQSCTNLTSVKLPDNLQEIRFQAFLDCSALESITIPATVHTIGATVFGDCTSLKNIALPDKLSSITNYLFKNCTALKSVVMPSNLRSIGNSSFLNCSALESLVIPELVKTIGENAFSGCIGELTVNSTTVIETDYTETQTWLKNTSFSAIKLGEKVTKVGEFALAGTPSMTAIYIPTHIQSLGTKAFADSAGELVIDNSLVEKNYDFWTNPYDTWMAGAKFTKLTIGEGVKQIGNYVFTQANSITEVVIKGDISYIGAGAFDGLNKLITINIPSSVTSIGDYAFDGCSSLTSITIPDGITSIGEYTFSGCSSLTSVTIPDKVTMIGNYAFRDCSKLTSVTIGKKVSAIDKSAFRRCSNLTSVYCKPVTPPALGDEAFGYTHADMVVYVSRDSVKAYDSSSYWDDFTITGYDF